MLSDNAQTFSFHGSIQFMKEQGVYVTRWPSKEAVTEAEIQKLLANEGLLPYKWSNNPGDVYSAHSHGYSKVIYVVQGSIIFGLPESGQRIELFVGDRLDLPSGIQHNAQVGSEGVVCLEAHH
jgi:quercetin dioxygenase-like cupin family protein